MVSEIQTPFHFCTTATLGVSLQIEYSFLQNLHFSLWEGEKQKRSGCVGGEVDKAPFLLEDSLEFASIASAYISLSRRTED